MKHFFLKDGTLTFPIFGFVHIGIIAITILIVALMFIYRDKLKKYKYKEMIKKILVIVLFMNMLIYYVGRWYAGVYTITEDLPLQYCFITGYLLMYMLWFNKKKWFNYVYYGLFMCTITVIIWLEPGLSYDQYAI